MMNFFRYLVGLVFGAAIFLACASVMAQADRPIYTENMVNNFSISSQNVSYSVSNALPVHAGSYSINATITASGGYLSFQHGAFNNSPYRSISFWINGGTTGGQSLKVYGLLNGSTQTAYILPILMTNVWQQFVIPLTALGCSNQSTFTGFRIQNNISTVQPVFYVDDVYLGATPAPAVVHLNIFATQTNRVADARWFGVNAVDWDGNLGNSATIPALKSAGITTLRWPGGSGADVYFWTNNIGQEGTFRNVATNLGVNAQAFITVNYGTGNSNLAAGYVLFDNLTNHCHFKYWEIGNECYGTWETDSNTNNGNHPWDPYTYAVRAASYMAAMRAADPTIKIGVVATPGDDSDSNGYNSHPALNPRTGVSHNGWVPVMLATLKSLGAQPDFLIHHVYPQYTQEPVATSPPASCVDSDMFLLQGNNWPSDAATLRQEIADYFGPAGTNIELCCTENNSDANLGGKQLSSLVNGLYEADTMAHLMQTEFNSYLWWDIRNGNGTQGELDATLYGWRQYGDEGLITGATGYNPAYYGMKMMQYFVRPGDTIVKASSDYLLLSTYADIQTNGTLKVLVVNKDPIANLNGQFNFTGYLPASNAVIHTYGESQDNAAMNNLNSTLQDVAITNVTTASNLFNYSFPPYSLTVLAFTPSGQIVPNIITLSAQMTTGQDWNTTNLWSDGNAASNSAALPGYNVYEVLPNARLRTPVTGPATFPGNVLTIDGDGNFVAGASATIGELRFKSTPTTFTNLVMNGGQIDESIGGGKGIQCVINGEMEINANTPIYDDSANDAGYTINSYLAGNGQIEYHDLGFVMTNGNTMNITCNTNAYYGTWNVIQGTLLGSGANALGTNSITVGATGVLETTYDINNPNGSLTLNGQILLHQNDTFSRVTIGGIGLYHGTYSFAYLSAYYPAYFPTTWILQSGSSVSSGSGSITVLADAPQVWNGNSATDNNWGDGNNWASTVSPLNGDALIFAGTTSLTPNMETSYTIISMTFSNNAGSFNITNAVSTLTLTGGVTNNSANPQTLNVPVNLTSIQTFNAIAGSIAVSNSIAGTGGIVATGTTNILAGNNTYTGMTTVNGGVLILSGTNNVTPGSVLIIAGTLVIGGAGLLNGGNYTANLTDNGNLTYSSTVSQTNSGVISGLGSLTVSGSTLTIGSGGVAESYMGATLVTNGVLNMNFGNVPQSGIYLSSGLTINKGGAVVIMGSSALEGYTGVTPYLPVTINTGGTLTVPATISGFAGHLYGILYLNGGTLGMAEIPPYIGNTLTYGGWSLNNNVIVNGGVNTSYISDPVCIPNETGGTIFNVASGGTASGIDLDIIGQLVQTSGSADTGIIKTGNGTMRLNNLNTYTNFTTISNGTFILNGELDGGTYARPITNLGTFIYTTNVTQTFSGIISGTGIIEVNGLGSKLILTASNTYSGSTIINNGMLLVNNASGSGTGSGTVMISSGGTLGGRGIISGMVTNQAGGILAPGAATNTAGTVLTISNLTLLAGSTNIMVVSHNGHTNDQNVSLAVTYGGTLMVSTNLGDAALAARDRFILFKSGSYSGNFSIVSLPALSAGLLWVNNLLVDGSITVASNVVANFTAAPTNGFIPLQVVFADASTGSITNWIWNFGNGNSLTNSSSTSVTNTYALAGTYDVSLIVSGTDGSGTNIQMGYIVAKPAPVIANMVLSGGNLVLSGTNGPPGVQYQILTSTNIALPLTSWTPVATNVFAYDGSYSYTNIFPTNVAGFFLLISP